MVPLSVLMLKLEKVGIWVIMLAPLVMGPRACHWNTARMILSLIHIFVGNQDASEGPCQGSDQAHPGHGQGRPLHQPCTSSTVPRSVQEPGS